MAFYEPRPCLYLSGVLNKIFNRMCAGSAILSNGPIVDTSKALESQLIVQYKISGERRIGAHAPVRDRDAPVFEDQATLTFTNSFILQMPVLEQLVAIGMLPVPIPGPRVGQQVIFQWRIERLKEGCIKVKNVEGDGNQVAQESLPSSSNAEVSSLIPSVDGSDKICLQITL